MIDELFIDSEMLKFLINNYKMKFDVVKSLLSDKCFKGDKIFGTYVNNLFEMKKLQDKYKDERNDNYNPALRETIKLYLNSLTGKLVVQIDKYNSIEIIDIDSNNKNSINGNHINKISNGKINPYIMCGIGVYSHSKRHLFKYIECLPHKSNDVINVETYSIYFEKQYEEQFLENLKNLNSNLYCCGSELGNIKKEKENDSISYFLMKKTYCISFKDESKNVYKAKGIPNKTIDQFGNSVKLLNVQMYEDLYNGKEVKKEYYTLIKTLFGEVKISSHKMSRTLKYTNKN